MNREETIRFLRQLQQILIDSNSWKNVKQVIRESFSMAIEALEAQRWISVSEKPKTSGYYNCTCYDGVTHRVTTLKWSNGWILTGQRAHWRVIAWMPLPKPYTEGNE